MGRGAAVCGAPRHALQARMPAREFSMPTIGEYSSASDNRDRRLQAALSGWDPAHTAMVHMRYSSYTDARVFWFTMRCARAILSVARHLHLAADPSSVVRWMVGVATKLLCQDGKIGKVQPL